MKKFALGLFSAVLFSIGISSSAFANEDTGVGLPVEESIDLPTETEEEGTDLLGVYELSPEEEGVLGGTSTSCVSSGMISNPICTDTIARTIKYSKENVKTYNQWSNFKRVSDNLSTGSAGGSIYSNESVQFGVTVNGAYQNLGFSLNKTMTSLKGYNLIAGKNVRVYMGYRVMYAVETGTRVSKMGTRVISRQTYTVKRPQYGEYKLINYK